MQDSRRPTALHAALQFVLKSNIPSDHKATLIEVLTQTLRDDEARELDRQALAQTHAEWQEHEVVLLKSLLQGRIATSWQHADECVMQLATQLQRDPRSVRDKAVELGFNASVDYHFARELAKRRDER